MIFGKNVDFMSKSYNALVTVANVLLL